MGITARLKIIRLIILWTLIFFSAGLWADTIVFTNGKKVIGKVVGQDREKIQFRSRGKVKTYQKKYIKVITYGNEAAELKKAAAEKARREAERKRREAAAKKKQAEAERKRREAAAKKKQAEAERKKREAAAKKKQAEAERKKREVVEKKTPDPPAPRRLVFEAGLGVGNYYPAVHNAVGDLVSTTQLLGDNKGIHGTGTFDDPGYGSLVLGFAYEGPPFYFGIHYRISTMEAGYGILELQNQSSDGSQRFTIVGGGDEELDHTQLDIRTGYEFFRTQKLGIGLRAGWTRLRYNAEWSGIGIETYLAPSTNLDALLLYPYRSDYAYQRGPYGGIRLEFRPKVAGKEILLFIQPGYYRLRGEWDFTQVGGSIQSLSSGGFNANSRGFLFRTRMDLRGIEYKLGFRYPFSGGKEFFVEYYRRSLRFSADNFDFKPASEVSDFAATTAIVSLIQDFLFDTIYAKEKISGLSMGVRFPIELKN